MISLYSLECAALYSGVMKTISLLGSTGSIGESTLKVVRHLKGEVRIGALAARSSIDKLEEQAREFNPELIAVYDENKAALLRKKLPHIEILSGMEGLKAAASHSSSEMVLSAMVGTAGFIPTVAAIEAGKDVALANKESLVSGGALVMSLVKKHGVNLIPVDSEHSAIFQCLVGQPKERVNRLILTASGGPFRTFTSEQLAAVTLEQALRHPTWTMGAKITVDSSTLMNKGLEVIEAYWLFGVPIEKISVVVHPQSIIHSLVEFVDNSLLAQMGVPSMIVPIQYALTYPDRLPGMMEPFDFLKHETLQFFAPDPGKFRCLRLAFDSLKAGGSLSCYMNGANEILVEGFLNKKISWWEIATHLETLMQRHQVIPLSSVEDVISTDSAARRDAGNLLKSSY